MDFFLFFFFFSFFAQLVILVKGRNWIWIDEG